MASKTIAESKTCKDLFLGKGAEAIDLLSKLAARVNSKYDAAGLGGIKLENITDAGLTRGISNWRNGGYEVTGVKVTISTAGLSNADYVARTLIHELGHAFEILFGTSSTLIKNDRKRLDPDGKISAANDQLVDEKCFR